VRQRANLSSAEDAFKERRLGINGVISYQLDGVEHTFFLPDKLMSDWGFVVDAYRLYEYMPDADLPAGAVSDVSVSKKNFAGKLEDLSTPSLTSVLIHPGDWLFCNTEADAFLDMSHLKYYAPLNVRPKRPKLSVLHTILGQ
jgi:hypothetical protein